MQTNAHKGDTTTQRKRSSSKSSFESLKDPAAGWKTERRACVATALRPCQPLSASASLAQMTLQESAALGWCDPSMISDASVSAPDTSVYPAQHMSIYRLPPNEIAHAGGGH